MFLKSRLHIATDSQEKWISGQLKHLLCLKYLIRKSINPQIFLDGLANKEPWKSNRRLLKVFHSDEENGKKDLSFKASLSFKIKFINSSTEFRNENWVELQQAWCSLAHSLHTAAAAVAQLKPKPRVLFDGMRKICLPQEQLQIQNWEATGMLLMWALITFCSDNEIFKL